ncbi:hypothetical protein MASR1M12_38760 [Erysipelotrichia bacterium]
MNAMLMLVYAALTFLKAPYRSRSSSRHKGSPGFKESDSRSESENLADAVGAPGSQNLSAKRPWYRLLFNLLPTQYSF